MTLALNDILGSTGNINSQTGIVTLNINDFVDENGVKFLDAPTDGIFGAQKFLAAYFAYLALRCPQQFDLTPEELEQNLPKEEGTLIDATQAFVAQENQITDGFSFEKRGEVTQIRYDFIFSIYLQNTFSYDADLAVGIQV
jgi:hypothetical protein